MSRDIFQQKTGRLERAEPKRAHSFRLVKTGPTKNLWECKQCDSAVYYGRDLNQTQVNQLMGIRMPCLPGIYS